MSNYVYTIDGCLINVDELKHYGVPGMKWGVHRASSKLRKATTSEARDKAISKLNKHKKKATDKIAKLNKQRPRLQKDVDGYVMKKDIHAAKLKSKATRLKRKAGGIFTSEERASKLLAKAAKLDVKSDRISSRSNLAKAKLERNKLLTRQFEEGITDIEKIIRDSKSVKKKKK